MEELAQVYGRALFEVAQEQGKLDLLREQLGQFADALGSNRDLELFFFSPYFSTAEKQAALGKLLDGADERLLSFLNLLIENHRMPVIFRVRREYERLWEDEKKLLPVVLTSAVELDEQTIADLSARIGERTGRTVDLTTEVQPDILGGIVVRIGNSILDASIRNRLEQLRAHVASGVA
ncbi:MAG TPA: ATP synthase F1 subunit delta [Solirubrobacteraceae bacterium]|jgi:ATP synthase F1 delta subunit|nr:ATP synthase F1 subunit delta [Solirubrobacteraceae bacterium]